MEKTDKPKQAGFYAEPRAIEALRVAGIRRGVTFSSIVREALADWWARQPESKEGPLFSSPTPADEEGFSSAPPQPTKNTTKSASPTNGKTKKA